MRSDLRLGVVVSTTDLLKYLSCEELSVLDLLSSTGQVAPIPVADSQQLAAKMGLLSEAQALELLQSQYGKATKIAARDQKAFEETLDAMKGGAKLIYQGLILRQIGDTLYESRPDFLVRVDYPSDFGGYAYEPMDSKLSKSTKLDDLFQVLDYADGLNFVQGVLPKRVHLVLAGVEQLSYKTEAYIEEIRLQKEIFLRHVARSRSVRASEDLFTRLDPQPNRQCVVCDWAASCGEYWERSDSLFRVAGITKSQVARLTSAGVTSLSQLAQSKVTEIEAGISADVLGTLIAQARAQLITLQSGASVPYLEIRPDAFALATSGKGIGLLPKPSDGDIFFDIEGDPFYKPDGLEYLLGITFFEKGVMEFKAFWGTNPTMEKEAFGDLIEFIMDRWSRYPDLHIYHYADYERSALSRLASRCNYKVFEVDTILRNDLLVDLYPAVKGTLLVGTDSYSLKKIEKLYLPEGRHEAVTTAMGSVETFEAWLGGGDDALLHEIEHYNEMDVRSTGMLRDFLLSIRQDISASFNELPYRGEERESAEEPEQSDRELELAGLELALYARADQSLSPSEKRAFELCGDLVGFHTREEKPIWWRYFNLISPERERQDFLAEPGSIGGLSKLSERTEANGSSYATYSFDHHQSFKIGDEKLLDPDFEREILSDPERGGGMVSVGKTHSIDFGRGLIEIKRDSKYPRDRDPENLVAWSFISSSVIDRAIQRFAARLLDAGKLTNLADVGVELLMANKPRFWHHGRSHSGVTQLVEALDQLVPGDLTERAIKACEALDRSYLVIQGPPGAGKTFLGAKVVTELVNQGKKVFVTALSHSAVDNFIEAAAPMINDANRLIRVAGAKAKKRDGVTFIKPGEIESHLRREGGLVVGGTIWNGAREELAKGFDYGFIDEAGQFSLANSVALSTSCRSLVFIGDPQQLSQPVLGSHPAGAASSVLEHLVGDQDVVDDDFGLFLPKTYRMHPHLTEVVSAISYDSRLSSMGDLERLELVDNSPLPKNGLVYIPVEHRGNTYRSMQEVAVAKTVAEFLLRRSWINKYGDCLPVTSDQIMVVAPYNAQVNALSMALEGLASVGTVDRFQGREAPFVIVSLSASDGDSSSRGVDFLFSINRLNVAISRAKVMSIILASPALIETKPNTIEQLRLLGAVTKVVKSATRVDSSQFS